MSVGGSLAAGHMNELRLLLWAEWWVATLGRRRWWLVLGAEVRKLFWRGALEFYCCDRATEPGKLLAKLYRLAIYGRSENRIGKKVIGRGNDVRGLFCAGRRGFARSRGVLALINQPTGYGCGGIFFKPLVHQRADLFAKVGGMAEARELITLQAITRSGQQKLPGGAGGGSGSQGSPVGTGRTVSRQYHCSTPCQELLEGTGLWKIVENARSIERPRVYGANGENTTKPANGRGSVRCLR